MNHAEFLTSLGLLLSDQDREQVLACSEPKVTHPVAQKNAPGISAKGGRPDLHLSSKNPDHGRHAVVEKHIVIRGSIPASSDRSDVALLRRYEGLRSPIRLEPLPDLATLEAVRAALRTEFPWAEAAIEAVMSGLIARRRHGSRRLGMSPVLLVGVPGTGKTRFAQRLGELLETPNIVINMAGMEDVKLLKGVTRGWGSNRPSRLIEFILQERVANPFIILDEIDKAHAGYRNGGDPQEALLDLLEPGNARRYQDIYLMTECDLSHCMYIATSNSINRISEALLSRLQPVFFPKPGPEHAEVIVKGMIKDLEISWNVPAGTIGISEIQMSRLRGLGPREMRVALLDFLGREAERAQFTLH